MEAVSLKWVIVSGYIEELHQQCQQLQREGEQSAVFKFVFQIDPCELLQYNAQLGNLVLHKPQVAWKLLQQVCYMVIKSLDWLPSLTSLSQLLLVLRLRSLPDLPGYTINHVSELPSLSSSPRFYMFKGVVCGMTTLDKYTQHACFSCSNEHCSSANETIIRLHVPGASEAATVREDNCSYCGSQLLERITFRTLADKLFVHLVPSEALHMCECPWRSRRYQAVGVVVRDELCVRVKMGGAYTVIGLPTFELADDTKSLINTVIETNNILPSVPPQSNYAIPTDILQLHHACQYSPWALAATLAYSFAAEVSPPGSYHRLKLAMLLSLVSCTSESNHDSFSCRQFIDVLAVGSDTELLLQLMLYGSSFAPRSLLYSTGDGDLFGIPRKTSRTCFIDGGSLVLAERGVCLVGNISLLKSDTRDKLEKVLERKLITVSIPQRLCKTDVHSQQLSWPLRCTVWAYADQQHRKQSFAKADSALINTHSLHQTSNITKGFADHMTLLTVVDPKTADSAEHLQDMLSQHLLQRACGVTRPPVVTHDDFKHLITALASPADWTVGLHGSAKKLLTSFYLASRRVRQCSSLGHTSDIPHSALDHMTALTLAHAKLSLRKEATEADAVMGILIYEESLVSRFGYSVLNIQPCAHFNSDDITRYIGKQFDADMRDLHKQIVQFCKVHDNSSSSAVNYHQREE